MRARARSLALGALLVAAPVLAQPSRVGCGPTASACGPAGAGLPGTAPGAPTWVPSAVAVWLVDEASGTRTNAQGTTARNLAEVGGSTGNNTVQFREGTAAAELTATPTLETAALLGRPYTCTMWVRPTTLPAVQDTIFQNRDTSGTLGDGFAVDYNSVNKFVLREMSGASQGALNLPTSSALNVWAHVGVWHDSGANCALYVNGVIVSGPVGCFSFILTGGVTRLGGNATVGAANTNLRGEVDEIACWSQALSATSLCRICSCGVRGEQCACSGASFTNTGRNASGCSACTLPADCSAAAPS